MADDFVLFGGTFDPVHHGHLIVARAVAEHCRFGKVHFVPARTPPHKAPAAAGPEHRLAMLRRAVEGEPSLDVCDIELTRPGPSYTFQTLEALRERLGASARLHLLVGADMLADLPNWREAGRVAAAASILAVARGGLTRPPEQILSRLEEAFADAVPGGLRCTVVPAPRVDISSTEIRRRVAGGRSIRYLVPEAVAEYIRRAGLYRPAP